MKRIRADMIACKGILSIGLLSVLLVAGCGRPAERKPTAVNGQDARSPSDVKASAFGWKADDSTVALQAAIDSAAGAGSLLVRPVLGNGAGLVRRSEGALAKDAQMEELAKAIRRIHSGKSYVSADIANYLAANPAIEFDAREREIMQAISRGLSNEDIAAMLKLSVPRIKQLLKDIYAKLGVANRAEAIGRILREHFV